MSNITTLVEFLLERREKKVSNAVSEAVPFINYQRKTKRVRPWSGESYKVTVKTEDSGTAEYVGIGTLGKLNFSDGKNKVQASFEPKAIVHGVAVDDIELDIIENSERVDKVADVLQEKETELVDEMSKVMEARLLYNASPTSIQPTSLLYAASNAGTVGGIAQSGNTYWQMQTDTTSAAGVIKDLSDATTAIWEKGGTFDLGLMSPTLLTYYVALMQNNHRYVNPKKLENVGLNNFEAIPFGTGFLLGCPAYTADTSFIATSRDIVLQERKNSKIKLTYKTGADTLYSVIQALTYNEIIYKKMHTNYYRTNITGA